MNLITNWSRSAYRGTDAYCLHWRNMTHPIYIYNIVHDKLRENVTGKMIDVRESRVCDRRNNRNYAVLFPFLLIPSCSFLHIFRIQHSFSFLSRSLFSSFVCSLCLFLSVSVHGVAWPSQNKGYGFSQQILAAWSRPREDVSVYGPTALVGLGRLFSFLMCCTVSRTPWTGDQPSQGCCLHIEQRKQNKSTRTAMLRVGFEPTILVFERAQRFHALDRESTVIGS
jgi:hypothetical protein